VNPKSIVPPVTYDQRSLLINGKRKLILSGAMHYPRSSPEQWEDILTKARDAGINTIDAYVFWNLHESKRGVFEAAIGQPTQPRYLMPQSWFAENNTLILFEEIGGDTATVRIEAPRLSRPTKTEMKRL